MDKRLIENYIPLEKISLFSQQEKSIRHGHPSTLHIWFARRPLAASRAVIFSSLLKNPKEGNQLDSVLNGLIKALPWSTVKENGSNTLKNLKNLLKDEWKNKRPKILDPFAGGGSIPLEGLRLGCETYANDLNPISVLLLNATLRWSHLKMPDNAENNSLLDYVEKYANIIYNNTKELIGTLYPQDSDGWIPNGYLWTNIIICSNENCSAEIPLIKHFWLCKKKNKKVAYKPVLNSKNKKIEFIIQNNSEINFDPSKGTLMRGNAKCLFCGNVVNLKKIKHYFNANEKEERMTVVVLHHPKIKGKKYRVASKKDKLIYSNTNERILKIFKKEKFYEGKLPEENLPIKGSLGINLHSYGFNKWHDLFNDRQKLSIVIFMEQIKKTYKTIETKFEDNETGREITIAIIGYLTLIFGRLLDKNAKLVIYNAYGEKIEHVFARSALPIIFDYVELNVFSGGNGDWVANTNWVLRFIKANVWKVNHLPIITKGSATNLYYEDNFFDAIICDPPYYDNIAYSDLSDFFYVWFKKILDDIIPDLFSQKLTPKNEEIVANRIRQKNPREFFERELTKAFREMYRCLKDNGITVIIYGHQSDDGWLTMLKSIYDVGFVITASWPINTERRTRLRARSSAALTSTIHLVCRKSKREESITLKKLNKEIKIELEEKIDFFLERDITGVDFLNSLLGVSMKHFTRFRKIEGINNESISIREYYDHIKEMISSILVEGTLKVINDKDIISKVYLLYRFKFKNQTVVIEDFNNCLKENDLTYISFKKYGELVKVEDGEVKVLSSQARSNIPISNFYVDIMHQMIKYWEKKEYDALYSFVSKRKVLKDTSFWKYCQAIIEVLPKGEKERILLESLMLGKGQYLEL